MRARRFVTVLVFDLLAVVLGEPSCVAHAEPLLDVLALSTESLSADEAAAVRAAITRESRVVVVTDDDPRSRDAALRARVRRAPGGKVDVEVHRVARSASRVVDLPEGGARLAETAALVVGAMVRDEVPPVAEPSRPIPTPAPTIEPTAPEPDLDVTLRALGGESRDGRSLRALVSAAPILVLAPVSAVMFVRDEPALGALAAGFAGGSAVWSLTQLVAHGDPHAKLLVRYEDGLAAGKPKTVVRDDVLAAWASEASDARSARRTFAMVDVGVGGALLVAGGAWLAAAPEPVGDDNRRLWRDLGWTGLSLGTVAVIAGIDAWTSPWPVESSWQTYRTTRPAPRAARPSVSVGLAPGGGTVSIGGAF